MKKFNFFLVLLSFAAVACTDNLDPIQNPDKPSSAQSEKFFQYSGKEPYINQMLSALHRPQSRTAVVNDFVDRFGVPNWDHSLIFQDRDGLMGVATAVVRADTLSGLILSCEDSIAGRLTVFVEKCPEVMQDENFSGMANVLSYELNLADKLPDVLIIKRESEPAPGTRAILYQYDEYQCYGGYAYLPEDMIPHNIWEKCYYLRTVYILEKIYDYKLVPQRYINVLEGSGGGGGMGSGGGYTILPGSVPFERKGHNKIIDDALKSKLTETQIEKIKEGSFKADLLQTAPYNHVHGLKGIYESNEEAIDKTQGYFTSNIMAFQNTGDYTYLGKALHPIMDAYSEAHENWSVFRITSYNDWIFHRKFDAYDERNLYRISTATGAVEMIYKDLSSFKYKYKTYDVDRIFNKWLCGYKKKFNFK